MDYISTRGHSYRYSSLEAILEGLAPDGGLLVPSEIPTLSLDMAKDLLDRSYPERVASILQLFMPECTYQELLEATSLAYHEDQFGPDPAKLSQLNAYNDTEYLLELWHGPTSAFKDMALQLLPHLMQLAMRKLGRGQKLLLLTATSGDTGKAALEGFRDVEGIDVLCFYPKDGVSKVQELQMTTTNSPNVKVIAVEGSFDEAQAGVKASFASESLQELLIEKNVLLTSANSINWGRLVAQIAYYWSAYLDLVKREKIDFDTTINFAVPTGNFGNILAAWYAREMGLPIGKLICASNRNNVLSDFLRTGNYSIKRKLYQTNTPSMDILISSNLERLIYMLSGQDSSYVFELMKDLTVNGEYFVGNRMKKLLQQVFVGGFSDDRGVVRTILQVYDETDHVIDPHTAVAFNVYNRYRRRSKDDAPIIFVSTASPYKFAGTVSTAIFSENLMERDEFELFSLLEQESDLEVPEALIKLPELPIVHTTVCKSDGILDVTKDWINGGGEA